MNVVIVESAAKAKTINKYLGSGYKVIASFGHVRDLPAKNGSVEPDKDFEMHWDVDPKSQKIMKEIADAVKKADKLILATDPDREGEAISWHILQILEQKKALKKDTLVERVAFNAVTKQAILTALSEPRQIDGPLVSAYLARRALDYLVGFTLSPVLWRKLPGARSAGRVQSVALRLVCDREAEIEAFRTDEYWTIDAQMLTAKGEEFPARLNAIDGTTLKKLDIKTGEAANAIKAAIEKGEFRIVSVDKKGVKRNPYAPFATSTLQMDASRKLGFSAKQTMQVAQRLYEGVDIGGETVGLITYMRTDGVTIVPEAVNAIRGLIAREYSQRFVAPFIREYKTKAKNAQEAHEAIRPTEVSRKPSDVAKYLEKDQARLYELVWKRAVASQMASAEVEQTTADIEVKGRDGKTYTLRATGSVIQFEGFLKVYEEGRDERMHAAKGKDDVPADDEDASRRLPALAQGDKVTDRSIEAEQHFTQPPPRFSEATLVKKMEELGIGRPSTYASTLAVLQERQYVRVDKKRLIPEDKGRLVIAFLEGFFKRYVEYDFTADLEEKLDLISDGKLAWKDVLRDFWKEFTGSVDDIKDLRVGEVLEALNEILGPHIFPAREDGSDPRSCPSCKAGRLSLKISGKYGAFIGCGNYPECRYTRQLSDAGNGDGETVGPDGKQLGFRPRHRPCRDAAHRAVRALRATRRGLRGRKAEALEPAEGRRCGNARSRLRREAAVASARGRDASRIRQAHHRRPRPLRALHPARWHVRQRRRHRGSVQRRPQSRRHPAGRESRRQQESLPARQADGAQGSGRASRRRRQDRGAVGTLWPVRQARRRQCHDPQRQGPGGHQRGRSRRADCSARGQGSVEKEEACAQS